MVPPTPFLPTKVHIPADQSLLLATEPIWEDESVNMGAGGHVDDGDETFWLAPPPNEKARTTLSYAPAAARPLDERLLSNGSLGAKVQRSSPAVAGPGPISSMNLADPSTNRQTKAVDDGKDARRTGDQMEEKRYTGMTGRRDRRALRVPSPVKPAAKRAERDGAMPVKRRRDSPEKQRIPKQPKQATPTKDRSSAHPAGSTSREHCSPEKQRVPKKPKLPTPKKDDFYSRRVKDSDRRSSLGPKSPMVPEMVLHASPVSVSHTLPMQLSSSRSVRSLSSSSARPSPLSASSSVLPSEVVQGALPAASVNRDNSNASDPSCTSNQDRAMPRNATAAESTPAERSFSGNTALSRYLAKADNPDRSRSDRSSGSLQAPARASSTDSTPSSSSAMASDTAPFAAEAHRTILDLAGNTLRSVGGALRRSLSRSSFGSSSGSRLDTARSAASASGTSDAGSTETDVAHTSTIPTAETGEEARNVGVRTVQGRASPLPSDTPPTHGNKYTLEVNTSSSEMERTPSVSSSTAVSEDATKGSLSFLHRSIVGRDEAEHADDIQADEVPTTRTADTARHRADRTAPYLPAPLTRPSRPFGTVTATRALQPRVHVPENIPLTRPSSSSATTLKCTVSGAPNSLAARALARLPPLGHSATDYKTTLKQSDHARDLAEKRARFEALSRGLEMEKKARVQAVVPAPPRSRVVHTAVTQAKVRTGSMVPASSSQVPMARTVPIRGNTPGKASRARAEAREQYDAALRARQLEREAREREVQRAREELEQEEMRVARMESVVVARELPAIYCKKT